MGEMQGRIAQAVIDAVKADCIRRDGTCYAYGDMGGGQEEPAMEVDGEFNIFPIIDAVLAALAEPTEAMIDIGGTTEVQAEDAHGDEYEAPAGRHMALAVWKAMIGAAQ